MRAAALLLLLLVPGAAIAQPAPLQAQVETILSGAAGARFGLVASDDSGREIVSINADQRFIPASNAKILTSATAFATLGAIDQPDSDGGARVRLEGSDVVLEGRGDARLSSAADCRTDCLAVLADAVAARTRQVGDVIGDDRHFPDERWSAGMSWNNIPGASGTAISALTLDDNVATLKVVPGTPGQPPLVEGLGYYTIDNRAVTVAAGGATDLGYHRLPFERRIVLIGTIAARSAPRALQLGIDDPADYAAWRFKALLETRGVKVGGKSVARHRLPLPGEPPPVPADAIATLVPAPLQEDLGLLVRDSQNLHAELILRRLGRVAGNGSVADGLKQIEALAARAGLPRTGWDQADGSGMSTYNRMSPRTMALLLRWIATQPWSPGWRATLAVGGVDGTIARRFRGTVLGGKVFAKTGTLNATNALAGYLVAKSGRTLSFAFFANDVPSGVRPTPAMDAALVAIAEAN